MNFMMYVWVAKQRLDCIIALSLALWVRLVVRGEQGLKALAAGGGLGAGLVQNSLSQRTLGHFAGGSEHGFLAILIGLHRLRVSLRLFSF